MEDAETLKKRLYEGAEQTEDGCLYKGSLLDYSRLFHSGKAFARHRLAYELEHGPIPEGKVIMHKCDNPGCFNPSHLDVGTQAENLADMRAKGRANDHKGMAGQPKTGKTVPFLVRMRPEVRDLLERAAHDQRRSMASLIDEAVRDQLNSRYGKVEDRVQRFLMGVKQ